MLQQEGRSHRVDVFLPATRRPAHLAHGSQCPRRRHPLVPHGHLQLSHAPLDIIGEAPRGVSGVTLGPRLIQGETDDDPYNIVLGDLFE